ncbi:hypothetical protein [Salinarimonas ramus]|uniref:Cytochrome c n=1 Tax=Salinarimonas ramus TaxID=690164 RepID=A0A917V2X6_9HYPH|nr:hypothetical protein [Salinarimonas ramus]GGK27555.1 hypothetical protein GCM10011322_12630 [Salinarimonas ramus]
MTFSTSRAALAAAILALGAAVAAPPSSAQGFDPMRPGAGFNPMLPQSGQPRAAPEEPAIAGNPDLGGIPDDVGAEETFYLCSACHSMSLVTQQRLTDARWDYTWDWMVEEQGMPEMDDETKELVLSYLKRHFSAER